LEILVSDGNKDVSDAAKGTAAKVWYGVAGNPATPVEILAKLGQGSGSPHWWPLFLNQATPTEVRERIADFAQTTAEDEADSDGYLECVVAARTSTPSPVLASLATNWRDEVREAVAENPSTPPEILTKFAEEYKFEGALARNPSTPPEILTQLASDADGVRQRWMKTAVARNPATPPEVRAKLESEGI